MLHITIIDTESKEVMHDGDANAIVFAAAQDKGTASGALGLLSGIARACVAVSKLNGELAEKSPEFWPLFDFFDAMSKIEDGEDADDVDE